MYETEEASRDKRWKEELRCRATQRRDAETEQGVWRSARSERPSQYCRLPDHGMVRLLSGQQTAVVILNKTK